MSDEMAENTEKKVLRGDILKALGKLKREWIGALNFIYALKPGGYENLHVSDLRLECEYLAEKGYLETKDTARKSMGITLFMIHLTVKGQDLLEGSLPDDVGIILHE